MRRHLTRHAMPAAAAMDDALTAASYRHDTAQSLRLGNPATKETSTSTSELKEPVRIPVAQDRHDGVTQRLSLAISIGS